MEFSPFVKPGSPGPGQVARVSHLEVLRIAIHQTRLVAIMLDSRGFIGNIGSLGGVQRTAKQASAEHLRRLRQPQPLTRHRG
jgi:hypothetical protein